MKNDTEIYELQMHQIYQLCQKSYEKGLNDARKQGGVNVQIIRSHEPNTLLQFIFTVFIFLVGVSFGLSVK